MFNHESDVKMVMDHRPWSIINGLLSTRDWPPNIPIEELVFTKTPIWVQIHGLPPNQLNAANAKVIGDFIGELIEVDLGLI